MNAHVRGAVSARGGEPKQFKVGDRVSLRRHPYILNGNQQAGTITGRVKTGRGEWVVDIDNYDDTLQFHESEMAPVSGQPVPTFAVGDRVRIARGPNNGGYGKIGDVAAVVTAGKSDCYVKFETGRRAGESWYVGYADLEAAPSKPARAVTAGSRVRIIREPLSTTGAVGLTATVKSVADTGRWPVLLEFDKADVGKFKSVACPETLTRATFDDVELVGAESSQQATPAIVAPIENGQPKPSDRPFVHPTRVAAEKEAKRLAGKHKGKEFGVYEFVSSVQEAPQHEWQRLAAAGKRAQALATLARDAGVSGFYAEQMVREYAA